MTNPEKNTESTESQIIKFLKLLRPVPKREKEAAARSRARFMAEAEELFATQEKTPIAWLTRWLAPKKYALTEEDSMNVPNRRFAFTALATVIVLAILLFGGAGATALAAQSALPGDALYSLKTGIEQTQVSLSSSAYNRAQLQMEFGERRLDEIAALIADGRFNDIGQAVAEFESHIQSAIGELQAVAAGDPARASELANQITAALSRYALTLSGMLANVPDAVKPEVERALMASQGVTTMPDEVEFTGTVAEITKEAWKVGDFTVAISLATEIKDVIVVGDFVKVHAFEDDNGILTAREIELSLGDDDVNTNANDNSNESDDNANDNQNGNSNDDNGNLNDNDDDDDNLNSNLNSNDDDDDDNHNTNGNSNSNDDDDDDDDDNGNSNSNDDDDDDDDDNGNSNSNDNDDDDNGNSNSNDNDDDSNSNSNDNDDNSNSNSNSSDDD